jgi:two-component system osmolarity sensor histidine kinase EnvZ
MLALLAAARAVGAGQAPLLLDVNGPIEISALAHAFNAMARELDAQDRERALMLAGISHDLRTPLAKIRLALELIGPAAEPGLRTSIERSVENANRVVDQFIEFGRGTGHESPEPTDLDAIARSVAADAGAADASAILVDGGCPPGLYLRPRAIRRLLVNLVDNALKYAGPPIVIRTRADATAVTLSVIDAGPGIPSGDADRLVRPFVRGSAARDGVAGAGLGLAIVERIARLHGGRAMLLPAAVDSGHPGLEVRVHLPRTT